MSYYVRIPLDTSTFEVNRIVTTDYYDRYYWYATFKDILSDKKLDRIDIVKLQKQLIDTFTAVSDFALFYRNLEYASSSVNGRVMSRAGTASSRPPVFRVLCRTGFVSPPRPSMPVTPLSVTDRRPCRLSTCRISH